MVGNMWESNNGETEGINISEHLSMDICETAIPIVEDNISKQGIHSDSVRKENDEILSRVDENRNNRNSTTTSVTRDYELRFSVQVSDPVLTGVEIRGKDDTDIKIDLYDQLTGNLVVSGPESEARVEILFLDALVENFNNSIIMADNKPQFRTPVFVHLKEGIGKLPKNLKILRPKNHMIRPPLSVWMKNCKCRLGARVVEVFGSRIKEATTHSFTVSDKRSVSCKNRDQPSLFDDVRTIKNIGKTGVRRDRLRMNNVSTVQEFLFLLSVDPQGLEKIFGRGHEAWMSAKDHASKCNIDDKRIYYLQYSSSSSECTNGVVFDVVGQLKGVLRNNSYVPIESVAEAEKDNARKSLAYAFKNQKEAPASPNKKKASAFENWNVIDFFDDEASFLRKFPNSSCHSDPSSSRSVLSSPEPSSGTIGEDQGFSMSDFGELMEIETVLSLFQENGMPL